MRCKTSRGPARSQTSAPTSSVALSRRPPAAGARQILVRTQRSFGLAPLLVLHGVSRSAHGLQSLVKHPQASQTPLVLFDLDTRHLKHRVSLTVPVQIAKPRRHQSAARRSPAIYRSCTLSLNSYLNAGEPSFVAEKEMALPSIPSDSAKGSP
jgi:hypothetical protein